MKITNHIVFGFAIGYASVAQADTRPIHWCQQAYDCVCQNDNAMPGREQLIIPNIGTLMACCNDAQAENPAQFLHGLDSMNAMAMYGNCRLLCTQRGYAYGGTQPGAVSQVIRNHPLCAGTASGSGNTNGGGSSMGNGGASYPPSYGYGYSNSGGSSSGNGYSSGQYMMPYRLGVY